MLIGWWPPFRTASVAYGGFLHVYRVAFLALASMPFDARRRSRRLLVFASRGRSQIGKPESKVCMTFTCVLQLSFWSPATNESMPWATGCEKEAAGWTSGDALKITFG